MAYLLKNGFVSVTGHRAFGGASQVEIVNHFDRIARRNHFAIAKPQPALDFAGRRRQGNRRSSGGDAALFFGLSRMTAGRMH